MIINPTYYTLDSNGNLTTSVPSFFKSAVKQVIAYYDQVFTNVNVTLNIAFLYGDVYTNVPTAPLEPFPAGIDGKSSSAADYSITYPDLITFFFRKTRINLPLKLSPGPISHLPHKTLSRTTPSF
jgi:hypothetical protein